MIERGNETTFDWGVYAGSKIPVQWYFRKEADMPVAVQAWMIEPGAAEGMHTHHDERPLEELYIVVDGEAEVTVDGEVSTLVTGDAFLAKVRAEHNVKNIGTTPLRMIVVWGPPAPSIWDSYSMGRVLDESNERGGPVW